VSSSILSLLPLLGDNLWPGALDVGVVAIPRPWADIRADERVTRPGTMIKSVDLIIRATRRVGCVFLFFIFLEKTWNFVDLNIPDSRA